MEQQPRNATLGNKYGLASEVNPPDIARDAEGNAQTIALEVPDDQRAYLRQLITETKLLCAETGVDPNGQLGQQVFYSLQTLHRSYKVERLQKEFNKRMQGLNQQSAVAVGPPGYMGPYAHERL